MATQKSERPFNPNREWMIFQLLSYSRIAARKHGISIPAVDDLDSLSDEELADKIKLLQELAHLPPG